MTEKSKFARLCIRCVCVILRRYIHPSKQQVLLNINTQYKDIQMCKTQEMRLEHEITESEVADAVSTLKLRKAPGIDGIQAEHLKYGRRTAFFISVNFLTVLSKLE